MIKDFTKINIFHLQIILLKPVFTNKKYPAIIQKRPTLIVNSLVLIEKQGLPGILKLLVYDIYFDSDSIWRIQFKIFKG